MQAYHVRLVDADVDLDDRQVADRHQEAGLPGICSGDGDFSLLHSESRDLTVHGSAKSCLGEPFPSFL